MFLYGVDQRFCRYIPKLGHRLYGTPPRQAGPRSSAKRCVVIRVRVPLDLHAVSAAGSAAFALATPLRVRELLVLAVREAIGARAPHDKFQRSIHRTLSGLAAGDFTVDIDGRHFVDAEDVVMCAGCVDVRFFVNHRRHAGIQR